MHVLYAQPDRFAVIRRTAGMAAPYRIVGYHSSFTAAVHAATAIMRHDAASGEVYQAVMTTELIALRSFTHLTQVAVLDRPEGYVPPLSRDGDCSS